MPKPHPIRGISSFLSASPATDPRHPDRRPRAYALTVATMLLAGTAVATSPQIAAADEPATVDVETESELQTQDTTVVLPSGQFKDIAVDNDHQQMFVAMAGPDTVVAADLNGNVTGTTTGLTAPGDLAMSEDGDTLYVVEVEQAALAMIDAATKELTRVSLPETQCPVSVAVAGGKAWYSYKVCGSTTEGGLGVYDPATGEATDTGLAAAPGSLRAASDRLFLAETPDAGMLKTIDVSGETPTESAQTTRVGVEDAALTPDADQALVARQGSKNVDVFNAADLSAAAGIDTQGQPNSVAVSSDGKYAAVGNDISGGADTVEIRDIDQGTPGSEVRTFAFSSSAVLDGHSLEFTDGGALLAVTRENSRESLHILNEATKKDSSLSVTSPKAVDFQTLFKVSGTLDNGPGSAAELTLTRTDRKGTVDMGTVPVTADGGFFFKYTPTVSGSAKYTLSYAGDAEHIAAEAAFEVFTRPMPFDLNGDGRAETVVGAPGEDIGPDSNTGSFTVFPSTGSGTTGTGAKTYDQETTGVPGSNEDGDQLGFSNSSGDYNADGYADLAVSANAENLTGGTNTGSVLVFYGSSKGLSTTGVVSLYPSATKDLYFGDSLATGDFNGDGRDDLAVGAPGGYSGSVYVYPGSTKGLSRTTGTMIDQNTPGVPGVAGENDLFGWTLSSGDIDADGRDDLAVGAMYDWETKGWSTGSTTVLYGSANGITGTGAQRFTKSTSGVPGGPGTFNPDKGDFPDNFGQAVALADFDGDGAADLAVGAPGSPVTGSDGKRKADAGTVTVLYADGGRISTTGAIQVTQATGGVPGGPGAKDHFGTTLAAGDANRDGKADLAIFSTGDHYVYMVNGSATGLAFSKAKTWTQDSPGIPGADESGDLWGDSLRFSDVKGTGYQALIVGADGENSGAGAFTVVYSTSSGLTGTGAKYFSQDSSGVPGAAEKGDGFGMFP